MYRRGGYDEKALIEVLYFAFEVMLLDKLTVFCNELNNYYHSLLLYVGFKVSQVKPAKPEFPQRRYLLSLNFLEFEKALKKNFD